MPDRLAPVFEKLDAHELWHDPYSIYARMRVEAPVHKVILPGRDLKAWLVTRYADVRAALADPRLSKDYRQVAGLIERHALEDGPRRFATEISAHMLNSDPPDHERLRRLVGKAFTARRIEQLRPRITEIAEELLTGIEPGGEIDLLSAFAFPLPIAVICELLGVPIADRDDFQTWSNTVTSSSPSAEIGKASAEINRYLSDLIDRKREEPGEDMLSVLVGVSEDNDRLSHRELVSMAFLLLIAGHETTVNLIGNGTLALLRNPDQLAALRADPGLIGRAVEEFLRFEGPVNVATFRFTTEPVEIGGVLIPEGEFVFASLGSANRDQDRYPHPDRLDLSRDTAGHLAFGHGIHYCLGAPLARLEAEIAFGALLRKFDRMELAVPPESLTWRSSTLMRGLIELPVRF